MEFGDGDGVRCESEGTAQPSPDRRNRHCQTRQCGFSGVRKKEANAVRIRQNGGAGRGASNPGSCRTPGGAVAPPFPSRSWLPGLAVPPKLPASAAIGHEVHPDSHPWLCMTRFRSTFDRRTRRTPTALLLRVCQAVCQAGAHLSQLRVCRFRGQDGLPTLLCWGSDI